MTATSRERPRIWLVLGDKVGDNRQVERVAEALNEPFEVRRVRFLPRWQEGKPPFLPSLYHLDRTASDPLEGPWPELILTIGRRPAMVALWIRRRSGNRTRIVLFGRPKRFFDDFALIVAPAQFGLPERDSVVRLGLPLIRLDPQRVEVEAERWRERLADLPRPLTVLLVGGRTRPYRMDADTARDLLEQTIEDMPAGGGLYVSTSRRTPADVVEELRRRLPEDARLFSFAGQGDENPYFALLKFADRFVVTVDSVSMITEVISSGRTAVLYRLPVRSGAVLHRLEAWLNRFRTSAWLLRTARESGLVGWPRDLTALSDLLVARGWARILGRPISAVEPVPVEDELEQVVQRIRGLLDQESGA